MATNHVLLPYRLRTVRTGVQATFIVVAGLAVFAFLPHDAEIQIAPYLALMAVAAAGAVAIMMLPWQRLFESARGMHLMYAWSILDILIISAVIAVTGGHASDLFWIYTLTAFFMAASYPPRAQLALLAFTYASYLGVLAWTGSPFMAGSIVARFSILGVLTFMASFLSREQMSQIAAHREALSESERGATLIATVARATRSMSTLDSDGVLRSVIDGVVSLGFEAANFGFYDDASATYRVSHARGLPPEFTDEPHPADAGMTGLVRRTRRTQTIDDYTHYDHALPLLRGSGFVAVIGSPIWVNGRLEAVLVGGTHQRMRFTAEDIEAFELLAGQAGRALENARRFEAERRTVERLAELDRMKQDFLSNVSHELRTPLTAILGMGETLLHRWTQLDDERRLGLLERVTANAETLDDLISTLLDFSRLEAGKIRVEPVPVDVGALASDVARRLEALFGGHLTTAIDDDLVVHADPQLLERVLENLLSNAAKHTPEGTSVDLTAVGDGSMAVVSVRDEGLGIPADELAHLGERFYRGGETNTRQARGTGLGLAFVREVLTLHGAHLDISSRVGSGSTFTFRLPRIDPAMVISSAQDSGDSVARDT